MRNTAATGPDDLSILIVKRCFREPKTFFQLVFNACLKLGFFPSQWKHAKVLALRKPGKDRYDTARAYRPISLLNHFGKLFESVMNTKLKNLLECHEALSPFQAGFRPGKHAQGACWRVVEEVISVFRDRAQVQAVSLDIQAAYDSVWRNGLLAKMKQKNLPQYLIYWSRSFFFNFSQLLGESWEFHSSVFA